MAQIEDTPHGEQRHTTMHSAAGTPPATARNLPLGLDAHPSAAPMIPNRIPSTFACRRHRLVFTFTQHLRVESL